MSDLCVCVCVLCSCTCDIMKTRVSKDISGHKDMLAGPCYFKRLLEVLETWF